MDELQNEEELQQVIDALSVTNNFPAANKVAVVPPPQVTSLSADPLDVDSLYIDLILRIKKSVDNNAEILEEAALTSRTIGTVEYIDAYANVAKSNSELLKTLSNAITERDRIRTQERLKKEDNAIKKEIAQMKQVDTPKIGNNATITQNNFIIKANRDTLFKSLYANTEEERKKAQEKIMEINNPDAPPVLEATVIEEEK